MAESAYRVSVPDLSFYQASIPCQFACPVRTDARGYVTAIAQGEYERAYLIARETNPFASTCGWVCGAPCEAACRRGKIDTPIAIRALKRFVDDRYGVYLGETGEVRKPPAWPTYVGTTAGFDLGNSTMPSTRAELVRQRGETPSGPPAQSAGHGRTGKRVAIIGSGPAGLTCAHDLALLGHDVTIFEASSVAGGMLKLGVPEYRLPRELIDLEIKSILALGPTLKLNQALGRDFSLADLRKEFDAVFIGIGTYASRKLNVEGEQFDSVLRAVDFLINVNLGGYNLDLGKRVIVIGGGNVAMDVARAARRLGTTQEVHCLVVEDRSEMLADPFEVREAEEEGIVIHNHVAPKRIVGQDGHATGVETLDVSRTFDERGRFNPQLIPGTEKIWEGESVIISIGQTGALEWIKPEDGLETTPRGTLALNKETLMTTAPGVFCGGDIAFGPRLIINAVADGQRAARGIHSYLQHVEPRIVRKGFFTTVPDREYANVGPLRNYLRWPRRQPPSLPVSRRIGVAEVEQHFEEPVAQEQGGRCLICSINPIFDGELCIMCNGCVDVCPMDCLKLVPVSSLTGDEAAATVITQRTAEWSTASAMLLDPARCIRCGLCAARCPTDAVQMETFRFTEEIQFVET